MEMILRLSFYLAFVLPQRYPADKHEHTGVDGGHIDNRMTLFSPQPKSVDE